MSPAMRTACCTFLAACLPDPELIGSPRIFGMLESVTFKDRGDVPKLEKLAALRLVDRALADPEQRKELVRIVESNFTPSFTPLVFGDCSTISRFIVASTPVETFFDDPHVFIWIEMSVVMLSFSEMCVLTEENPRAENPIEKLVEIVHVLLRKPLLRSIVFRINKDIPDAEAIGRRFVELRDESPSNLSRTVTTIRDDYIKLRFCNQIEEGEDEEENL